MNFVNRLGALFLYIFTFSIKILIEFFKFECDRALENIKDSYRRLTEDQVTELSRIKNPP